MNEANAGTATVEVGGTPVLRTDGPCLCGTLGALQMPTAAVDKIRHDAIDLLGRIASVYAREIATGEIGASGTGVASAYVPNRPCTGLLYGRIQSGKTVAMIALAAAALDNGFRVVVVLTSDNLKLVSQTTERFGILEGPIVIDALTNGWETDHKHIGKHLRQSGVVFVCSKNKKRLDDLIEFLERVGAPNHPALVLDDEADQASLDTNLAKNSRARSKGLPGGDPTAIYERVVEQLSGSLRHHVFLQVTATPYALLLQSVGTPLRPSFVRLLEPGEGYTGGEAFFEAEHLEGPKPPLVFVPDNESGTVQDESVESPDGLRQAISFFLVAAAAQSLTEPEQTKAGQNFLCHTSQLRTQHRVLEAMVRTYVDKISDNLEQRSGEGLDRIHRAYDELLRTFPAAPTLDAIVERVERSLVGRKVVVVNAEANADLGRGLNFIVGGNILGRGVTIESLLVTYYLREPKIGQMDTMLQHARMYGYRAQLMHLTRVFLPRQLAVRFHEIHRIETRLRRHLVSADLGKQIVIEKAANLNPTRRTVLDPSYIDAFDAGDQLYPIHPDFWMKPAEYDRISAKVRELAGEDLSTGDEAIQIPYETLLELVDEFPFNVKAPSSSWVPAVIRRVLERQRERCAGVAYLYARKMARKSTLLSTGALEGPILKRLRTLPGPVFCAFRDDGKNIDGLERRAQPFWYPTVVLDRNMPNVIVNTTPDGV